MSSSLAYSTFEKEENKGFRSTEKKEKIKPLKRIQKRLKHS